MTSDDSDADDSDADDNSDDLQNCGGHDDWDNFLRGHFEKNEQSN